MASRKKFVIPSGSQIKESNDEQAKQFSKFKSFQLNKDQDEKSTEANQAIPSTCKPTVRGNTKNTTGAPITSADVSKSTVVTSTSSLAVSAATPSVNSSSAPITDSSGVTSTSSLSNSVQGTIPSTSKPASSNSIIVNYRQRGNPVLKHIRNVPWEYGSIIPDYVMGVANCALFLSLRYHQLHPEYLHNRLKELGKGYDLRVLLVNVDVKEPHNLLKDLAKICILADMTLILAFSPEEVGRYLEAYKVYENKPEEALMEKTETDYASQLTESLTTVRSVNKTDCMTLLTTFKSMKGIINAGKQDIACCAGFGPQKAQRLYDVFHEPFLKSRKRLKDTKDVNKDHSPVKKAS